MDATDEEVEIVDERFENELRPHSFDEVVGREREKETLLIMISAAKQKDSALDHILFHGPPGLGKTSLAQVVAKEMGTSLHVTSGPAVSKQGDLAALLTSLPKGAVLFIDEIHRLQKSIEEMLYPAMEDRVLDVVIGKGVGAKSVRLDLEPFTIIGATTRVGLLSKPLVDRFGVDFRLDYYELEEMEELIRRKAKALKMEITPDAVKMVAHRSRRTPRIAVKILKRLHDNMLSRHVTLVDEKLALNMLNLLNIDTEGLDYLDKKILKTIIENFSGGPVGLNTLAAAVSEEIDTLSEIYEPYLLRSGFLERTTRGRKATLKALAHLGYN